MWFNIEKWRFDMVFIWFFIWFISLNMENNGSLFNMVLGRFKNGIMLGQERICPLVINHDGSRFHCHVGPQRVPYK